MGSGQFASYHYNFYKQMTRELADGLSPIPSSQCTSVCVQGKETRILIYIPYEMGKGLALSCLSRSMEEVENSGYLSHVTEERS